MKELIIFLVMITVFVSYVTFIWIKYGVQKSISDSYYRLPTRKQFLFVFFCWGFAIPAMILGNCALMFLAGVFICFVGAAAAFKGDKMTEWVHVVGAYGGVLLSQLAIWIIYDMWYITVLFIVLSGLLYILKVKNKTWWVEIIAFTFICAVLLIQIM